MKIVIHEQKVGSLNGGIIFEADIFHSAVNPKISFWENHDGTITLNLHLWDSTEISDGFSSEHAKEMITTLTCAVQFAENVKIEKHNGQMSLFDVGV